MASSINPVTAPSTSSTSSASAAAGAAANAMSTPSESMFLNLLVAQMQNQDPLNPADSTQFVSQLAQFSELEQVIGIRSDTDQLASAATASAAAGTSTTPPAAGTTTGTSNTNSTQTTPAA
jgi:flagellar basal-body rod modification protein FlgD